jgi:hypothetical protein
MLMGLGFHVLLYYKLDLGLTDSQKSEFSLFRIRCQDGSQFLITQRVEVEANKIFFLKFTPIYQDTNEYSVPVP